MAEGENHQQLSAGGRNASWSLAAVLIALLLISCIALVLIAARGA